MSNCRILQLIRQAVDNGCDPEQAIPYSIECSNEDEYIEILYYALQILPEGSRRYAEINAKLTEVLDVRRTASQL